jgi:hypothetical protein
MKYYTFYRENNDFTDILNDPILKKSIDTKLSWYQHLTIGVNDGTEQTQSLITLKYGDEMVNDLIKDFSPKPGVDYVPKKDPSTFKKSMS